MLITKCNIMRIIANHKEIKLEYKYKITKTKVIRKNKAKTVNKLYTTVFPKEFFYQKDNTIYITSRPPATEYQKIKIQKTQMITIPKSFFNPSEFDNVVLELNLSNVDGWRSGKLGVLTMKLC